MNPNENFGELLATTLRNYREQLIDNIFDSSPLFFRLRQGARKLTGGKSIVEHLQYGKNPNTGSYSRWDALPMVEGEIIDAVEFNWKQYAGSVVIAGIDMRNNKGKHAMIELLKARIQNCEDSMVDELNEMLYKDGTGNDGKDLSGLEAIVNDSGTLAGIDRSAHEWWRAQIRSLAAETVTWGGDNDTMLGFMRNMYNRCTRGKKRKTPDVIIMTQDDFEEYEGVFVPKQRYVQNDLADAGFDALEFKKTPVVWDRDNPANEMQFLNSNHVRLCYHEDAFFHVTPLTKPYNQDGVGNHILLQGELTTNQSRVSGRLTNTQGT